MKKILLILAILIPILCLGQDTIRQDSLRFVVDGVFLTQEDVSKLDIEKIESMSVLREFPAGIDARNPIVVITLKKEYPEYEAMVLDAGFDGFLATQKSKAYYSLNMLKARNTYLVSEWNYRCAQPLLYDPRIYEQKIDYESDIDYGLEVEYTLYMFFKFMAEKEGASFGNLVVN